MLIRAWEADRPALIFADQAIDNSIDNSFGRLPL
jgi:hypothetical protein